MKAGWEIKTLGEIAEIKGGKRVPKGYSLQSESTQHPYITVSDFTDNGTVDESKIRYINNEIFEQIKKYTISSKDLYISIAGTIGKTGYVHPELDGANLTENACKLILHPEIDRDFVYYFTQTIDFIKQAGVNTRTAAQPKLALERLKTITLQIPKSLPEQKRLVTLLDEAFESIATAKANAQQNLKNARALFESHLNEVFTKRGEGWEEKTLGEVCILKSGTTVNATLEKTSGDLPYLKVADMNYEGNEIEIVSSSRFLNKSDIGRNAIIPSGTTIFPKRGGSILTNKKRLTIVPICADLNIMGVIPSDALLPKYLYFYFVNVDMRQLGSGSSIPQINNYDIEPLTISFPESKSQQEKIICEFEKLSEETQRLEALYSHKIAALDELKKALLHQAFAGEL